MRLGRLTIRAGWSMWLDGGVHLIWGYRRLPLLVRMDGNCPVYGRGGVLGIGPFMIWWQVEDR